mgnify:CR=1 FL=1
MELSVAELRRQVWAERLRRYSQSGLTVAAFCDQERVSLPSFYQWRRKLDGSPDGGIVTAQRDKNATMRSQAFVPVHITQSAVVEMRLPNGVQFWLPAGDAAVLAAAIAAAGSLTRDDGEAKAC